MRLDGERLKVRGPNLPEVTALVSGLRARHEEAVPLVREFGSVPPTLEEVRSMLPKGVTLVSYPAEANRPSPSRRSRL